MTRTNFRFVETSKLPWHACTVALVLVLMLAKPSGAQTDNTAYGHSLVTATAITRGLDLMRRTTTPAALTRLLVI